LCRAKDAKGAQVQNFLRRRRCLRATSFFDSFEIEKQSNVLHILRMNTFQAIIPAGSRNKLKSHRLSVSLTLAAMVFTVSAQAQTALESVSVPGNGDAVTFKTGFDKGELYLLKASGAVAFGHDLLDAEYASAGAADTGTDLLADTDVGIDTGLPAPRAPKGVTPGRLKWFGGYRADHVYYVLATGTGQPLTLKLVTGGNRVGAGTISVSLFRLSPLPADFPKPFETLPVSVLEETVSTALTTSNSVIYLLQTSGAGHVGGGGLAQGDAEYMDYRADGSGAVDVGDHHIDYGLGVDEADLTKSPRKNWWGPFRQDHTYFMLFAGTGQPIRLHYYDAGYDDNSRTDRLAVKIFPVP